MIRKSYQLACITPTFCGGAQQTTSEVRVPSIRGELRWWFRALGGFKALSPMPVAEQEALVFGAAAGSSGRASQLVIRVKSLSGSNIKTSVNKNTEGMDATPGSDRGYLLFPLRDNPRGVFEKDNLPRFEVQTIWKGAPALSKSIEALITVLGELGSIGFRSRRAMGALAFETVPPISLFSALDFFASFSNLSLSILNERVDSSDEAIRKASRWLQEWKSHGRTPAGGGFHKESENIGFRFAKNDHDAPFPANGKTEVFRPATGSPIIQRFSSNRATFEWTIDGTDRLASPIRLRPHRDGNQWSVYVIFIESMLPSEGTMVNMKQGNDVRQLPLSHELIREMMSDTALKKIL